MIRITFTEPTTEKWRKWRRDAEAETERLKAGSPPYLIKDHLYKRCREEIFEAYYRKCVYCEANFRLVQLGDVEHFRPKGAVRDENDRDVYVRGGAGRTKHPGYYWLAYDPTNLLPACTWCNSYRKRQRFPVKGHRAEKPGDEINEEPLLVHPCDEVADEFIFDPSTGAVGHPNERGQVSIEFFDLNREDLLRERRGTYVQLLNAMSTVVAQFRTLDVEWSDSVELMRRHREGRAAYSLAGRAALAACRQPLKRLFDTLSPVIEF